MAEAGFYNLNDVVFQVGEAATQIVGAADGEFISIEPNGDESSQVLGANGDTMTVQRAVNGYTVTLTLLATSSYITVLGALRATGNFFPVFYQNGASSFSGRASLQNRGNEPVSSAGGTRQFVLAVTKLTDTLAAQGTIFESGN